ncbi:hypothetical protein KNP414_01769 [Paenibacillus mucilaginosus KNP414]|uniref:7TM-DISM receptor extracellular domain-containing protein n=1 Tax=Paenibacillus mucilaginosus (strain KNP414) TaxID=1036673 RepID=F8FQB1_PAEMK|nr:hypothetical protein KNP414_01769 [Paenibacillus mucilaginosus KNP414]
MLVPNDGRVWALDVPVVFTAYRIWVNQVEAARSGTVGQSAKSAVPAKYPQVIYLPGTGQTSLHIVIQVSNYENYRGGLVYRLYPQDGSRRFKSLLTWVCSAFGLFIMAGSIQLVTEALLFLQLFILFTALYMCAVFIRAVSRRREGALAAVAGAMVLGAAIMNDVLYLPGLVHTGNFTTLGLFVFIFAQSYLLSSGFAKAFSSSEELAGKLIHLNASLEEKVRQRTRPWSRLISRWRE